MIRYILRTDDSGTRWEVRLQANGTAEYRREDQPSSWQPGWPSSLSLEGGEDHPTDNRLAVLLIDSNDTERNYYADRLKQRSSEYVLHEAATGAEALQVFQVELIDCVILELDLTDMSGFEILIRLIPVSRKPEIAVVVLTHLSSRAIGELALKNGAFSCLYKNQTSGSSPPKTCSGSVAYESAVHRLITSPPIFPVPGPVPALKASGVCAGVGASGPLFAGMTADSFTGFPNVDTFSTASCR